MVNEIPLDDTPDPCESPLLDPGSDGLVQAGPATLLHRLADYADQGHSLGRIRRDFALSDAVTNRQILRATAVGRQQRDGQGRGKVYNIPPPWIKD